VLRIGLGIVGLVKYIGVRSMLVNLKWGLEMWLE
jgi:hypothetical protein